MDASPSTIQSLKLDESIFNASASQTKQEIIRIIAQYLEDEGLTAARSVLLDEASVRFIAESNNTSKLKRTRQLISDGSWEEAVAQCSQVLKKNANDIMMLSIYRQQFLELIDKHDLQQAFTCLSKNIKPLQSIDDEEEIKDLAYLLTCKSVQEVKRYRTWEVNAARKKIADEFSALMEDANPPPKDCNKVPAGRLIHLLRQAATFQMTASRTKTKQPQTLPTLLRDFTAISFPNIQRSILTGHTQNVKDVEFVGDDGDLLASASSDGVVRIWDSLSGQSVAMFVEHASRIWSLASRSDGSFIASASADNTVKVWSMEGIGQQQGHSAAMTYNGHKSDVYSVCWHPDANHILSGSYDRSVRLIDVRRGEEVCILSGHDSSVTSVTTNESGTLAISCSKDQTIRFWDVMSGLCVRKLSGTPAEVTSVALHQRGDMLISATKGNVHDLYDLRMNKVLRRFRGHQNLSKNFIRASFGPLDTIMSGSEDGMIYFWNTETAEINVTLPGHCGAVYQTAWNARLSLLASCSDDNSVRIWHDDSLV